MIQKLLLQPTTVATATTTMTQQTIIATSKTLDEIESGFISEPKANNNMAHDLLSLELKRKLNIKSNKSKSSLIDRFFVISFEDFKDSCIRNDTQFQTKIDIRKWIFVQLVYTQIYIRTYVQFTF